MKKLNLFVLLFRLQFRKLIRMYECDLCFTPMIMADSFVKSAKARANEFQTDTGLSIYLREIILSCDNLIIKLYFMFYR